MSESDEGQRKTAQSDLRAWLKRRSVRLGLGLFAGGVAIGLIVAGSTATMVHQTNKTEFCVSCHLYDDFAEEYRATAHHTNATGVRAECGDCHIPHHPWWQTLSAKAASGSRDVWAYTVGGIDTPEDFEEIRADLAEKVWAQYRRNDSRFCRACHAPEAWDMDAQTMAARGAHRAMETGDATCIDCHQGIAHSVPEDAEYADAVRKTSASPARLAGFSANANEPTKAARRQGLKLYSRCTGCHGRSAPGREALGALKPDDFRAGIDTHMDVGGLVRDLTDDEVAAIYAYLSKR